ncbi:neurocan core protein isoform X3 [Brachyhypopomus gauderio]
MGRVCGGSTAVFLCLAAVWGLSQAETLVIVRRVTHASVRQPLAGFALLPCVYTLPLGPSQQGGTPRVRWSHRRGETETAVLSAVDGVVRVHRAYVGRLSLPGFSADSLNASLALSQLRTNDSGTFRCRVALGDSYEQDTVALEVTGAVFHYAIPTERYSLTFAEAGRACEQSSARMASPEQLWAAFHSGLDSCSAGWLSDRTVRYPVQNPELGCYGHVEYSRGVRNYGKRDPSDLFDVYCFASDMRGEVFPSSAARRLSLPEAAAHCSALGSQLATVGQLHLAWRSGLDHCVPGWLADGSVRYPVNKPRPECGSGEAGIRTLSSAELGNGTAQFGAYCYRAKKPHGVLANIMKSLLRPLMYIMEDTSGSPEENAQAVSNTQTPGDSSWSSERSRSELSVTRPSNWTGLVDLDKEPALTSETFESSVEYVTVRLQGDTSLDWSNQVDALTDSRQDDSSSGSEVTPESPGGSAKEEDEDDEGLSGRPVVMGPSALSNTVTSVTLTDGSSASATTTPLATPTTTPPTTSLYHSMPTITPSAMSTTAPSTTPTTTSSTSPINTPSTTPTTTPSDLPTTTPLTSPTSSPSAPPPTPSDPPTTTQSAPPPTPSDPHTTTPSDPPSTTPSDPPSTSPSDPPTTTPSTIPSTTPTTAPTTTPSTTPSTTPTTAPTATPTTTPSTTPTTAPTAPHTTIPSAPHTTTHSALPTKAASATPTTASPEMPTSAPDNRRDSAQNIMSSLWKPWSYLTGNEEGQGTTNSTDTTMTVETTDINVSSVTQADSPESGLTSWSESISSGDPSSVADKLTTSPHLESTVAPSASIFTATEGGRVTTAAVLAGEWAAVMTEVLRQEAVNFDLGSEAEARAESSLVPPMETEEDGVKGTEGVGGDVRDGGGLETEGSSWGDTDLTDDVRGAPARAVTARLPSGPPPSAELVVPADTAVEARGEVQLRQQDAPRRPGHRDRQTTTVDVSPTSLASEMEGGAQTTPSPDVPTTESPSVGGMGRAPPTAGREAQQSSFGNLLPGNLESGHSEAIRSNGSHGSEAEDRCSCLHGGTCLPDGEGFRCFCPQGYTGESCEIDVDDCMSNPCENGGTCIDKVDSFTCLCLPSYSGDMCEKDTEGCEHGWKKFHGHCYRLFPRRHTWEDAEKDCREHSGHLSSITSPAEQDFLNGLGHENMWIGLNDRTVEEDFQWTDSVDLVYENWRENQPDNFFAGGEDCVVMISREAGRWNDVPCNYNLPYICKKGTVMCSTPPAVDNAYLVGRRRSHYDIHSVVRYQCTDGFFQRHIPTARCRPNGTWERPRIICTKSRRSHRYRRQHHRSRHEHRRHRRHGVGHKGRD